MTRWGRARLALIALGVVAMLFVFVFPTRSYLAQRRQVTAAEHDVTVLRKQNAALASVAEQLQTQPAIQRMARQQFSMVFPGEHLYFIPPAAPTTTTTVP